MRNRFLLAALTLAAVVPTPARAQATATQREGSWEFSGGAGAIYLDNDLALFLASKGFTDGGVKPKRLAPAAAVRLGYNFNNHWGFSIGGQGATGTGVKYLTPFAALTLTGDLNARTSPFFTVGTQLTRIVNNGRKTHPTWGAQAGLGLRHMVGENVALRLEARMQFEHYAELSGNGIAYIPVATLGLSFFTHGRREPAPPMAPPPCPVCARARVDTMWRVDTVWQTVMQPAPAPVVTTDTMVIVLRDTLVLEGINFEHDKSSLTPESYVILNRVVRAMLEPEWVNTRWEIAGHTSSSGSAAYNLALSQRRAETVRAYLVSHGVRDNRLVARGYGEAYPRYPSDQASDWRNRRVELRRLRP